MKSAAEFTSIQRLFLNITISLIGTSFVGAESPEVQVRQITLPASIDKFQLQAQSGPFIVVRGDVYSSNAKASSRTFFFGREGKWIEKTDPIFESRLAGMIGDEEILHLLFGLNNERVGVQHCVVDATLKVQNLATLPTMPDIDFVLASLASSRLSTAAIVSPHPLTGASPIDGIQVSTGAVFAQRDVGWQMLKTTKWTHLPTQVAMRPDRLWIVEEQSTREQEVEIGISEYKTNSRGRFVLDGISDLETTMSAGIADMRCEGKYLAVLSQGDQNSTLMGQDLETTRSCYQVFDSVKYFFDAKLSWNGDLVLLLADSKLFPVQVNSYLLREKEGDARLEIVHCATHEAPNDLYFERIFSVTINNTLYYLPKYGSLIGF